MDPNFFLPMSSLTALLAQAEPAADVAKQVPWYTPLFVAAAVIAVTVVPFMLGVRLAKALRMNDYGWKLGLILASLVTATTLVIVRWPPKLGIDLSGGVVLVYEIDPEASRQMLREQGDEGEEGDETRYEAEEIKVDELVGTLKRRIDPGGVREIVVRPYGPKQIEIIIPHVSGPELEQIKMQIQKAGHLRFRITADLQEDRQICTLADDPSQKGRRVVRDRSGEQVAEWGKIMLVVKPEQRKDAPKQRFDDGEIVTFKTRPEFTTLAELQRFKDAQRAAGQKTVDIDVLMRIDPFNVEGHHLAGARTGYDSRLAPCINFAMTRRGAALFGALTGANIPDRQRDFRRKLGILMDNELLSAPFINDRITDRGQITGRFEQEEVDFLVGILKAGRLPAALRKDPISQNQVSPMLGEDTIRKGKMAIGISLVAVLIFMLVYYRFSGVVACLAVLSNLVLIFALMLLPAGKVALTLPGLAGLVLTVGMAVDANVLIFERIREELNRGAALRMALRNGFGRATTTIVDANLTTFITAIMLYVIGTEQIRGFAVTLILGILMSMYTAIFCSRVLFDIAERRRWITKLSMMRLLGETNIDFIGKRRIAAACSVTLLVIGIAAAAVRGRDIFGIDFNGGTSVEILLKESMPIAEVRARVSARPDLLPDAWVTGLTMEDKAYEDRIYKIDTSITGFGDIGTVKITDRSGKSAVIDLSRATSRDDIVKVIKKAGLAVNARPNAQLDGVLIVDKSGATKNHFIIESGDDGKQTAEKLNLVHNGPETSVDSGRLPDSVSLVENTLKEMFSKDGVSMLTMHEMKFDPPKQLAAAELRATPPPAPPRGAADEPAGTGEPAAPGGEAAGSEPASGGEAETGEENGGEPAPNGGDVGRADLPSDNVLAFAGSDLTLLAQAEPAPEGETDPKPEPAEEPAEDGPDAATAEDSADPPAEPPADPPATEDPPRETAEPEDAAPDTTPDTAPEPAPETPPEKAPEEPADATPEKAPADAAEETPEPGPETTPEPETEPEPTAEPTTEPTAEPTTEPATEPTTEPATGETPGEGPGPLTEPERPSPQPPAAAAGETVTLLSETQLAFQDQISAEAVRGRIESAAAALEMAKPTIQLSTPGWDGKSSRPFKVWTVKMSTDAEQTAVVLGKIRDELASVPVWPGSSQIGGAVAGKMQNVALAALMMSLLGIVGYIWFRFQKVAYGLAAVVALLHDVTITVGAIAVSAWLANYFGFLLIDNFKISLAEVAALLTIVGYSLNDTIVVFDRIREVKGKSPDLTAKMINTSINQTLSRTLLTSMTTLIVVLILYTLGGQGIHTFAFCLLVGVIVGTYSSVFVASPFLLWMSGTPEPEGKQAAA